MTVVGTGISELDPFSQVYRNIVAPLINHDPDGQLPWYLHLRIVICIIVDLQGARLLGTILCVATIFVVLVTGCVSHLGKCAIQIASSQGLRLGRILLKSRADIVLFKYKGLEITVLLAYGFSSHAILLCMGTGLVFDILVNFVTLKLFGIVPMPLYLLFPLMAILLPVAAEIILPMIIHYL